MLHITIICMFVGAIAADRICNLPDFAEDFTLLAGVVKGIAVAQQTRDGVLNKDDLAGELFLGRNLKMSSLDGLDGASFVKNLEDIGKEATNLCGSGGECEVVDVKSITDGFGALEKIQNSLTDEQKTLLKQTDTFKDLVAFQDALSSFIKYREDAREIFAALNTTDVSNAEEMASFLNRYSRRFRKVLAAKTNYEKINQLISTLESGNRVEYIGKIDALLQLEPVQKTISTEAAKIQNMKTAVLSLVQKVKSLSDALSGRTDRIRATMDKMVPILASSVRSAPHPLLAVFSDLDTTIRNFETKFLNGSNFEGTNAIKLKTQLEPLKSLITVMKPLHANWSSKNIPDDIDFVMNDIRLNLDAALAELNSLSSFSQIHQCIKDFSPKFSFSFANLKGIKDAVQEIQDNHVEKIKSAANPFDGLNKFEQFDKFSDMGLMQLVEQSRQINYTADVLVELEKFENQTKDLVSNEIQTFLNKKELSSVFADLKLGSVSDVVDCLRQDDLIKKLRTPVSMTSLSALKSDSFEMKTAVAAVNSLGAVSEEWNKIKSTPMSPGKRRRDVEGSVRVLNNAVDIANKLLDAAVVIRDLAKAYTARNQLKVLLEPHALENETETLKKMRMDAEFALVWNKATKTMIREFPANVETLDQHSWSCPVSMKKINLMCMHIDVFNFPHIDFHELARIARRAHKGTAITDFTHLDMRFTYAQAIVASLTDGPLFQSLDRYLDDFVDRDEFLGSWFDTHTRKSLVADGTNFSLELICLTLGSIVVGCFLGIGYAFLSDKLKKRRSDVIRTKEATDGEPEEAATPRVLNDVPTNTTIEMTPEDVSRDSREKVRRKKEARNKSTNNGHLLETGLAPTKLTDKLGETAIPGNLLPGEVQDAEMEKRNETSQLTWRLADGVSEKMVKTGREEGDNLKNGKLKKKATTRKAKNKQAKGGKEKKEANVKTNPEPSKAGSKQSSVVEEVKKSRKE